MATTKKETKPNAIKNLKIRVYQVLQRIGLASVKPKPKDTGSGTRREELTNKNLLLSIDKTLKKSESLTIVNISVFVLLSFELVFLAMIESLGYSRNGLTILSFTITGGDLELLSLLVCGVIAYFTYSYLKDYYSAR